MPRTFGLTGFRKRIAGEKGGGILNRGGEAAWLELEGRTHRLEGRGPWTIGRSKSNTVVVSDPYVSRHHAWISRRDGSFYIEDLGSSNGTLLNGLYIDREPLRSGDELSFGRSRARFATGSREFSEREAHRARKEDHPQRTRGKGGTLPYLPGLDGIRAIAVAAVLFYHANLSWIPGGFLGVTVFFVLSGYLITSLLLSEWNKRERVNLGAFWVRRARRLLPALYALLFVTLAFAAVFLPGELARLRYDAVAAFFYATNWYFVFSHQSYFQSVGRPSLFEHLWSLAVEEQFYLLWPVLFFVGMRLTGRRGMALFTFLLAVASSVWMGLLYSPDADPSRVYYGTDTRAAELLFGAALAFVRPPGRLHEPGGFLSIPAWRRRLSLPPLALDVTGLASLGATIVSMLLIGEFEPFLYRGGFVLVSLATLGVIAVAVEPRARFGTRMLGWEPLRWVGLRSYSIYLWHWPVFDMTRPALDVPMGGWPLLALRLGVTVLLADLSYRFVETPIRRGALGRALARLRATGGARRRRLVAGYATACSLFLGCCLALVFAAANAREPKAPSYLAVRSVHTGPDAPAGSERARPSEAQGSRDEVRRPATHQKHPAPTRVSPSQISAVGDSVMLGAARELQRQLGRGIRIDAIEGLQVQRAISILQRERASGTLGRVVIVAIGNNGPITPEQFDQIMRIAGPGRRVIFVNDKVPRSWEEPNDRVIAEGVSRYGNASMVDWRSYSENRPALFWSDGIHLRPAGARAYAHLLAQKVYGPGGASRQSGPSGSARSG